MIATQILKPTVRYMHYKSQDIVINDYKNNMAYQTQNRIKYFYLSPKFVLISCPLILMLNANRVNKDVISQWFKCKHGSQSRIQFFFPNQTTTPLLKWYFWSKVINSELFGKLNIN